MNKEVAHEILSGFKIKNGSIMITGEETKEQNNAIDYLCDEFDYCVMEKDFFQEFFNEL